MTAPSLLAAEIAEIPGVLARLGGAEAQAALRAEAAHLARLAPPAVLTVARGSSDHAAHCLKYAIELALGLPVASVGPSVASIYGARLKVAGMAALALSQSGRSADLLALVAMLRAEGAHVTALTNRIDSPLAGAASAALDLGAGPEHAVAATKSFAASVAAGLWLVAHWAGDGGLARALAALPAATAAALDAPAAALDELLAAPLRLTVIGRGPRLGLALEASLKLREVLGRAAEGYSAAEVLHGPATLIDGGSGIVAFGAADDPGTAAALARLAGQGARILTLGEVFPADAAAHPLTAGLAELAGFYRALERAARARGLDPDRPRFLSKETITL